MPKKLIETKKVWRKLIFLKYFIAYFVTSFSIAVLVKPKTLAAMVVPGRSYFIVMSDQTLFTFHEYCNTHQIREREGSNFI